MRLSTQMKPISFFKANAAEIIDQLDDGGAPMVITKNGEAKAVVMSVHEYEQREETLALMKVSPWPTPTSRPGGRCRPPTRSRACVKTCADGMADCDVVRFTRSGFADLDAIGDYMAQQRGIDTADALVARLQDHIMRLEQHPFRGPVPKELEGLGRDDIRQSLHGLHRIFYRVVGENVFVFMMMDGRRDIEFLLAERLRALGLI